MALSGFDLMLGRMARYLIKQGQPELATKLLSCQLERTNTYSTLFYDFIIHGPRDIFELLGELEGGRTPSADTPAYHLREAIESVRPSIELQVRVYPQYGRAERSAEEQTELYMFVFGDDPLGQQVQVLDVGPHTAPTRQLIVSPVPVLPVGDITRDEHLCFVMMPFAPVFRPVYDHAITSAVTAAGLTCRRGDDISQPGAVLTQIWQSILQARLVIADLTGANGNVLYELGLAHVLGHEAILLAQDIADVPFDLRHQRTIIYGTQGDGLETLRASLTAAIHTSLAVKK